ncbi:MAG TPA: hypothetical protein VJV78_39035 [Polyangiales bacterium]|nr:hypothetical protein [Polyangiales bacterium]
MQTVPVALAFLLLVAGCNDASDDSAAQGGSAGGLSDGTEIGLTRDLLGRLCLDFRWRPSRPQDGDHYSAKVVDGSGMTYLLLDHEIQYRDTSIGRPGAPCFQDCKLAEIDLRQGAP